LTGEAAHRERATRILTGALPQVEQFPSAFATILIALDTLLLESGVTASRGGTFALELAVPDEPVQPGDTFRITARLSLPEGWHVNANPPSEDYLIPTRLEVEPPAGFELLGIRYPRPTDVEVGFAARPLSVYAGTVAVEAELRSPAAAAPGEYPLEARLYYQACTETECQAPSAAFAGGRLKIEK